jgi:hypothetical protein
MPPCTPTRKKRGLEGSGWPLARMWRTAHGVTTHRSQGRQARWRWFGRGCGACVALVGGAVLRGMSRGFYNGAECSKRGRGWGLAGFNGQAVVTHEGSVVLRPMMAGEGSGQVAQLQPGCDSFSERRPGCGTAKVAADGGTEEGCAGVVDVDLVGLLGWLGWAGPAAHAPCNLRHYYL